MPKGSRRSFWEGTQPEQLVRALFYGPVHSLAGDALASKAGPYQLVPVATKAAASYNCFQYHFFSLTLPHPFLRDQRLRTRGFTLVELVVVILIVAAMAAVALPKYTEMAQSARIAAVKSLAGSVNSSLGLINSTIAIQGLGTPGTQAGITYVTMDNVQIRVWNGYPDRWCDGVGLMQAGSSIPSGGCYLSNAAVPGTTFTFYGYGSSFIPNGDAGWRIEGAPTPINCSVEYNYGGTGFPVVTTYTTGC